MSKRFTKKHRSSSSSSITDLRITKKQRSSSMADLNYDMIIEILRNLPVKSLLRFRSVCKTWCSTIDSSAFRKSRRKNNNDDFLFLRFGKIGEDSYQWELESMDRSWKFPASFDIILNFYTWNELVVHGPINGVLCMYDASPMESENGRLSAQIVLYNPVCCSERRILPLSPILNKCLCDGFDLDREFYSCRAIGFGFDDSDCCYKVVQIIRSMNGGVYIEVYSTRTKKWRLLDPYKYDGYEKYFDLDTETKAIKTGSGATAYWMIGGDLIVSFDMRNEVFGIIGLPEGYAGVVLLVATDEDDSLVLVGYSHSFDVQTDMWNDLSLDVWKLEIARGWVHVRNVDGLPRSKGGGLVPFHIAALWKYGLVLRTHYQGRKLMFYDYRTNKVKKCVELSIGYFELFLEYKVTLNSLDMCLKP